MSAYTEILERQFEWARERNLTLIGSRGTRGRPACTQTLDQNLFEPLIPISIEAFQKGNGSEISGTSDSPAKMQALHSSSALGVNAFQYWQRIGQVPLIASACGFDPDARKAARQIVFEEKYPIGSQLGVPPNVDVVIHGSNLSRLKLFAIESKFSEAYSSRGHGGLKAEYFMDDSIWQDIPALFEFAKTICPADLHCVHLHPAQLIKHVLGLTRSVGKDGFQLLYLWYDVLGPESELHRTEIAEFMEIAETDGLSFLALSYQELIENLSGLCGSEHQLYIRYMSDRYL